MKVVRILSLLFMCLWLFIMAAYPGFYDTARTAVAYSHYYDAPSDITKHELDEARKLDRRDIFVFESIMAAILAAAAYGFIRVGRKKESFAS